MRRTEGHYMSGVELHSRRRETGPSATSKIDLRIRAEDFTDGYSLETGLAFQHPTSNTEPLLRLNIEAREEHSSSR